ncbi:acyltransferase family protein [Raineyella fluvialis]|uniref:acyltransferase family protein n=1 Tax=Raineyella fluvialis TaxID=2662261 RepID=UPI0018900543|nr:acyltransferase [Raineyella fluvialis]
MTATSPRNVPIDAARALSILVVVGFHLMLFGVDPASVGSGGLIRTFVGSPGPVGWALSWFVMVMPLFFVAGGFANTHVLDRHRAEGGSYGTFLVARARRLLGPLVFYIAVWTAIGTVVAWLGNLDTAVVGTRKLTEVLWFLLVYLVVVMLAPVMVMAHDLWGCRSCWCSVSPRSPSTSSASSSASVGPLTPTTWRSGCSCTSWASPTTVGGGAPGRWPSSGRPSSGRCSPF